MSTTAIDSQSASNAAANYIEKGLELPLKCSVCQDTASGVHYGVPACEGCKGFFRRTVSSRSLWRACQHSPPLEMTPQNRNSCQWCRLRKCCAVNMGRERSKLGRRAKLKKSVSGRGTVEEATPADIPLPGCFSGKALLSTSTPSSDLASITESQLLRYIAEKRVEFATQVVRRSCYKRSTATALKLGCLSPYETPPLQPPQPPQPSQTPQQLLVNDHQQQHRNPKKLWLEKSQLTSPETQLTQLCQRLAGLERSSALEEFVHRVSFNGAMSLLILTAIDNFVRDFEVQLNKDFQGCPQVGRELTSNLAMVLGAHRETFYFSSDRMSKFRAEQFHLTREPTLDEEAIVLSRLFGYIPQMMLRIAAFSRSIFECGTSGLCLSAPGLLPEDKRDLVVNHCFQLIAMRFCFALVNSRDGYIIDPTMNYLLTHRFLQSAQNPLLSQLFVKFFDVSAMWDALEIGEDELAFLSAICLTSPYIGIHQPETQFSSLDSILWLQQSVVGLFWSHLRSVEMTRNSWTGELLVYNADFNLNVRLNTIKRIFNLLTVFPFILNIDGLHRDSRSLVEGIINGRIFTDCPTGEDTAGILLPNDSSVNGSTETQGEANEAADVDGAVEYRDRFGCCQLRFENC